MHALFAIDDICTPKVIGHHILTLGVLERRYQSWVYYHGIIILGFTAECWWKVFDTFDTSSPAI